YVGLFSHHEGFPNTICEAMALKKPIIVSSISDIPLFAKHNENVFICDSNDVTSIKKAIMNAMDSSDKERSKFGENNYNVAIENFQRERIIKEYLQLLT